MAVSASSSALCSAMADAICIPPSPVAPIPAAPSVLFLVDCSVSFMALALSRRSSIYFCSVFSYSWMDVVNFSYSSRIWGFDVFDMPCDSRAAKVSLVSVMLHSACELINVSSPQFPHVLLWPKKKPSTQMTVGEFENQYNCDSVGLSVARIIYTNGPPTSGQGNKRCDETPKHQI